MTFAKRQTSILLLAALVAIALFAFISRGGAVVHACGSFYKKAENNTTWSRVFDYNHNQYTTVNLDLMIYGDGCGNYEGRQYGWVADGTSASWYFVTEQGLDPYYTWGPFYPSPNPLVGSVAWYWPPGGGASFSCGWPNTFIEDASNRDTDYPWWATYVWGYYFSPHSTSFLPNGNPVFVSYSC